MTGLLILAVIALATLALLWLLRLRGSLLTLAAAALALGCAGYALQGNPGLEGSLRAAEARAAPLPLTAARKAMMGQFTAADTWTTIACPWQTRQRSSAISAVAWASLAGSASCL